LAGPGATLGTGTTSRGGSIGAGGVAGAGPLSVVRKSVRSTGGAAVAAGGRWATAGPGSDRSSANFMPDRPRGTGAAAKAPGIGR
jgi:hypothetical protein